MKTLKKKALVSALAGVFAFGGGLYMAPNSDIPTLTLMQAAEAAAQWEQGTITAEGFGTPPMGTYGSKASIMARRAAIVDAQRNLAEQVSGVQVDAETTVENYVISSDLVKTKVSALIKGAVVVEEQMMPDGAYRVVMSMPMYGTQGLASAIMPAIRDNTPPTPPPPVISATITAEITTHVQTRGGYTGVIIDCTGLGLRPVMSPVIKAENGRPIYGYKNLDSDKVVANGMASYARSEADATRAGTNPLRLRAVSVDGGANPVLSANDANRLLLENSASGFLDATNVVFLR